MTRVALTGGIGSGKSMVSDMLRRLGAVVIDADQIAREVVAPGTPGLAEIVLAFGPDVLEDTGALDRQAMARRVFGDDDARRRLEAIVHPRVRARAAELEAAAPKDAVVVQVIPLLVETGQQEAFDHVLVVDVPPEVQVERLTSERGMSAHEAKERMAAQGTREQRLAAADHVVVNDGSVEQLQAAVEEWWARLLSLSTRSQTGHVSG